MNAIVQPFWFTAKEAADHLRISIKTLYNLRAKGQLAGHKSGRVGKVLYSRSELDDYVTSRNPKIPKKKSA